MTSRDPLTDSLIALTTVHIGLVILAAYLCILGVYLAEEAELYHSPPWFSYVLAWTLAFASVAFMIAATLFVFLWGLRL